MMQVLFIKPLFKNSIHYIENLLLINENDMIPIHHHGYFSHNHLIILFFINEPISYDIYILAKMNIV